MPRMTLNPDELVVETFAPAAEPATPDAKPRTFEPGCTRDFCRMPDAL